MVKAKKILILLFISLFILSLFADCDKNFPEGPQQGGVSGDGTFIPETAANRSAATLDTPVPDRLVVLTDQTIGTNEPEKQKAFIEAFKKLSGGVELEIINHSDSGTMVIMRIASGEQTDIFIGGTRGLIQKEAVAEIEQPWIDESQNLKDIPEIYWDNFKVNNKKMALPYRSVMKTAIFIRQDWLDKLGLKAPVTIDDFYNVSKAFAWNDPDGNSKKDTYGYGGQNEWNTCTYFFFPIQNAFCKFTGGPFGVYDPDRGELINFLFDREDEYKAYLSFLQKSFREGIIEPQIFTNKEENLMNLFVTGKTGILIFYCINTDEIIEKTKAVNPEARISILAPPVGPQGSGMYSLISNVGMSVIKTTKNAEATVRYFCDVIHSPEGQQLLCYGPEGVNWKMENGVPRTTVTNPSMGLNVTLVIDQSKFKPILPFSPETETAIRLFDEHSKVDQAIPNLPVNEAGEDELAMFMKYYAKIITGGQHVEAGVKEWKSEFLERGFDKYYHEVNSNTGWKQD